MNQPDASAGEPRAGRNSRLSAEDWAQAPRQRFHRDGTYALFSNQVESRMSAEDWAQAALDLIAEQGVGAVAVEPLARRLGVTKGSFYWHFPSRDALLQAALERWELFEQEQVFGSLEDVPDPRVRLRQLFQMVAHEVQPHIIYSELLKALDHPMVRPVIDRVSQRRLDYLVASFRQAGLSSTDARHRARLAYAAYVGFLQLSLQLQQPKQAREDFEAYVEHLIETLIPS
jgi:AcrR family transcriptional regulator